RGTDIDCPPGTMTDSVLVPVRSNTWKLAPAQTCLSDAVRLICELRRNPGHWRASTFRYVVLSRITNKMFCASTICMRRTFGRAKHETAAVAFEAAPPCAAVVLPADVAPAPVLSRAAAVLLKEANA